jgi:hypothetical protein
MPYRTEILKGSSTLVRIGSGRLTGAEVLREAELTDAVVPPGTLTHVLVDLSQVETVAVSAAEIQRIARFHRTTKAFAPPVYVAIVAPPGLPYGLARMYDGYASSLLWHVAVFEQLDDARAWLEASHTEPEPGRQTGQDPHAT